MKDFESFLSSLESQENQKLALGARVTAAIFDGKRMLCGLKSGEVCLLGSDVTKFEGANSPGAVTCLCWVGADRCVSGHEGGPSRLWELAECREIAVLDNGDRESGESDVSNAVDDDCRAVLASSSGHLRLWDLKQIKQIAEVKACSEAFTKVRILGDKCVTKTERNMNAWDLNTLRALATVERKRHESDCIEFTNEGQCLYSEFNLIKIWDLSEKKEMPYKRHEGFVLYIKLIDENRCISGSDMDTKIWNIKDLSEIIEFPFRTHCAEIENDRIYLATQNGLKILDANTNQIVATIDLKSSMFFVHKFEEKCLCIPSNDNSVIIVELDQYKQVHELRGHSDAVAWILAWGSDKIITLSWDKTMRVWDGSRLQELAVLRGHSASVWRAEITADERCVTVGWDGCVKVWDLSNLKEIPTNMKHPVGWVTSVVVTSDRKAITSDFQYNIFVWNLDNYTKIGELRGHTDNVTLLVLMSDEVVISLSIDKTVRVWDIQHCAALAILSENELINTIVLASNNRCIGASADKTVKVWDLQKYALLATLRGHSDEVFAVEVNGEKCVSGSKDKTIIFWNLTNYSQEARVACAGEVSRLMFISSARLLSGDSTGEVKVWEDYREIASFRGSPASVIRFIQLPHFRLAIDIDAGANLPVWDLGQLSNCLSLCSSREILEKEIGESKPLLPQYRSRISEFVNGVRVARPECQMLFRPYFFNALHLCAYYNHPTLLSEYLSEEVPLVRGVFGSPLTLALERKTIECVDAILEHLVAVAPHKHAWKSFQVINDDLLGLLSCGSSKLEAFFSVLMQSPSLPGPAFITPLVQLPAILFATHFHIPDLGIYILGDYGDDLVEYYVSLVHWNLTAGSQESIELLTAAVDCEDRRVLLGDFFRSIISQKWDNCYPFTLTVSILYGLMLACLMGTLNLGLSACCIGYLALNGFFLLYELAQLVVMRSEYFTQGWNLIDIVRCSLSIVWASFTLVNYEVGKHVVLLVVLLDFIRGFTHFRSFRMTRIFVYMTFAVVAEMYSFLLIIAYSTFAFGIFTSVLVGETSLTEAWKKAYNLSMGNFDTSGYGALEWIVFTGATVTNIIIMMNLLISILGEAYDKAQMTMPENDMHMQANLILEYETLMVWRRKEVSKMWVVTCRNKERGGEQVEWSGKVVQIVDSLTERLSQMKEEINRKIEYGEKNAKTVGLKVLEIEKKVDNLGSKLDAVLSFLQPRS